MSRINIDKLNELQCRELIEKLLGEAKNLLEKGKCDESAKHLIMAAKATKYLPTLKRKEQRRDSANNAIKQKRNVKTKFVDEDILPPSSSSPFNNPEG